MTAKGRARPSDQALAVPAEPASGLVPTGFDPSRKDFLRVARSLRQMEIQRLSDCANAFVQPQPAGEDYHWQRLMAWEVLISDIKDGIPLDKAKQMLMALAYGKVAQ